MFEALQKALEELKMLCKGEVDDIKAKYLRPPSTSDKAKEFKAKRENAIVDEPSLADKIAEIKAKYGVKTDKSQSFDEKVKKIKEKYRKDAKR